MTLLSTFHGWRACTENATSPGTWLGYSWTLEGIHYVLDNRMSCGISKACY